MHRDPLVIYLNIETVGYLGMNSSPGEQATVSKILKVIFLASILTFALYYCVHSAMGLTYSLIGNPVQTATTGNATSTNFTNVTARNVTSTNVNHTSPMISYSNSTYGIRLQYPSTWDIDDHELRNSTANTFTVADLFPKISLDNTSDTDVFIGVDKTFRNSHISPDVYVHERIFQSRLSPGFLLLSAAVNSSSTPPEYTLKYLTTTNYHVETGKIVGNIIYFTDLKMPANMTNSSLLIEQAKHIADSFEITNPEAVLVNQTKYAS